MDLSNSFDIPRPIEQAWATLTDVELVAPCLPGAQLLEVEGNAYRGVVRVKFGPVSARYTGGATFLELNETDHKIVFAGHGLDARDAGAAEAIVTAKLEPVADSFTRVNVDIDLTLSGRVAQLSKGVIADVGTTLIEQFARNLAELLDGDSPVAPVQVADGHHSERRRIDMPEPEAIDLMDAARTPVLKRLLVATALGLVLAWLWRRRR